MGCGLSKTVAGDDAMRAAAAAALPPAELPQPKRPGRLSHSSQLCELTALRQDAVGRSSTRSNHTSGSASDGSSRREDGYPEEADLPRRNRRRGQQVARVKVAQGRPPRARKASKDDTEAAQLLQTLRLALGQSVGTRSSRGKVHPLDGDLSSRADADNGKPEKSASDIFGEGEGGTLGEFRDGFMRFKTEVVAKHKDFFRNLAAHQQPKVMIIGCCDSRVDPALLMGAGPGDIFVFRNIANLVPPYERRPGGSFNATSAALEYAVLHLKVEHVIVMGHKNCGGIKALMSRESAAAAADAHSSDAPAKPPPPKPVGSDFIDSWVEIGAPAADRARHACAGMPFEEQCSYCERETINVSLLNLLSFPWVKEAVGERKLQLHGWYYDLEHAFMETWQMSYRLTNHQRM